MDGFNKITLGFLVQSFQKNNSGEFACKHQEFIGIGGCDYEDFDGNLINPPKYKYQSYDMGKITHANCNWCGKEIDAEFIKFGTIFFCSENCLDECRAVQ